jgi:hypothetical protein
MFWPQFGVAAATIGLMPLFAALHPPVALAQTAGSSRSIPPSISVSASVAYGRSTTAAAAQAKTDAILAALSAEAGIPFLPTAKAAFGATMTDNSQPTESRLCVRAGVGLSVPVFAGPQMTVEHGLIGCPTNTGGLPIVVIQDPALQAPPATRTGDYNLDITVRYRLLQLKHMQVLAVASEQGVGYSLSSPVSGNNLLLGMSLLF